MDNNYFFSFIFISWRLITLQYCNGFKGINKFIKQIVEPFIYCWTFKNKCSLNIKCTETLIVRLFLKFNM